MSGRGNGELRDELGAALETRKELGDGYESEVLDSFVEKLDQRIEHTVDKRVRRRLAEQQLAATGGDRGSSDSGGPGAAFGLAVGSLVLAIPLSAIASINAGLLGLAVAMAGIVGVNACYAVTVGGGWRPQRHPSDEGR